MEMKKKAPSFQFYYRDFLHAIRYMSKEETYDYLMLLFEQADSATGSIPDFIFEKWAKSKLIKEKFNLDLDGYYNERMRDVLIKRDKFIDSQKAKINKRWNSSGNTAVLPLEEGRRKKEEGRRKKGDGILKKEEGKRKAETTPLIFPFTDEDFIHHWQVWKDYKLEQFKFMYKPIGEQAALKQVGEMADGNSEMACRIIEYSISQGWKGLFSPRNLHGVGNKFDSKELAAYMNRVSNMLTNE